MPLTVTIKQAVTMTGISRSSFYRMFSAGELEARKRGRQTLILVEDLEKLTRNLPTMKKAA